MSNIQFSNAEVAAKYNSKRDTDVKKIFTVHKENFHDSYHGMLSNISLIHAEFLVSTKDPDIEEKKDAAVAKSKTAP